MIRRTLLLTLFPCALLAQQGLDTVTVRVQPLRNGIYMLVGAGGNIGLSAGDDATFLIDDQYAPLTPKITAAVASVTPKLVRFVLNTHWHGDHTGGNENMGRAGALLVAHENVRKRMSVEQFNDVFNRKTPASPAAALPIVTFTDSVTFHLNGDEIIAYHVNPAHTDGDVMIHFVNADIVHMGDTFFNGGYPFVDVSSGGNVNGVVEAADRVLAACTPRTMIIPGHGALADCDALRAYRTMVATIRDRVRTGMAKGQTLAQLKSAGLSKEYDPKWGQGFIKPDVFIELVYRSLGGR